MNKVRINNKFICLLLFIMAIANVLYGCANKEKKQIEITQTGYVEDFGNEAVIGFAEESTDSKPVFIISDVINQIELSSLKVKDGSYTLTINGEKVGKATVSSGNAVVERLPKNLVLGNVYEVLFEDSSYIYAQKLQYVSKAIYDYEDLVRSLTYYRTYVLSPEEATSPSSKEKEKFYDGAEFSQRLFVLANDIGVSFNDSTFGCGGKFDKREYATSFSYQNSAYFYDVFDGKGNSIIIEDMFLYGVFGHIGNGAKIQNLKIRTTDNNYWNRPYNYAERNILSCSIAKNAAIENVAIMVDVKETTVMNSLNVVSSYINKGAKLKDIIIILSDKITVQSERIDAPRIKDLPRGFLGEKCYLEEVEGVYVVANGLKEACYYKIAEDEYKILYAENQIEADYDNFINGCYYYERVSDLRNERTLIGNWYVDDFEQIIFKK